ncbi:hypothetical protein F5Y15DRAFT_424635 [Xylariaceae sp. FL0016]|nr:hypothetical protein F5Y15DRAFT_424635 [Xylariaceae sp. FL0016]
MTAILFAMPSLSLCAKTAVWSALAFSGTLAVKLSENTQSLFDESMNFMDKIYDSKAGYLSYFYWPLAAGPHETRSSVWYATGLLQRNQHNDVKQAIKIIENVIEAQHKDPTELWYGDYQVYPEEPTVNTTAYPQVPYGSWDPNWRGFIGTNLIVIYEEFKDLLPTSTQDLILESLYNCTVGDGYRNGGLGTGLLNPGYSNPSIMRAVQASWVGRKMNDANMTHYGETYGQQVIDLFNMYDTLSEFNTATYYGVSIYGLTMWAKYLPEDDSTLAQNSPRMIKQIWESIGSLYNANLKNLAGPWDRSYGYDLNLYVGLLSIYIWSLTGKENAPVYDQTWAMAHADDFEYAPLLAVLAPFHDALVPEHVIEKLRVFPGDHFVETSAYAPPVDSVPRNITSYIASNLTIGGMSYQDAEGASEHSSQWNAAVIQWGRFDGSVGWITLAAGDQHALHADIGEGYMNLTYPHGLQNSTFSFIVAPNPLRASRDILSLDAISGLSLKVSGTVDPEPVVSFCGLVGGECEPRFGFEFWNLTFTMPNMTCDSCPLPNIYLEIELE